jgi:hypothetical protein
VVGSVLVVLALVAIVCVPLLLHSSNGKITLANYNRIQNGMTLQQVENILGPPTKSAENNPVANPELIYGWIRGSAYINVMFPPNQQNGLVIEKAQWGLR